MNTPTDNTEWLDLELNKVFVAGYTMGKIQNAQDVVYEPNAERAAILTHIDTVCREARIDELKKITKDTIEKPQTPENQQDKTWQGGYRYAKNSLKRYKLHRLTQLNPNKDTPQ
jgi:hypothetical protein